MKGKDMLFEIDFESTEALYLQLHDQIIFGIMEKKLKEGEQLPSVRSMAGKIGINMHTVNKAYALLRDEGFLTMDKRRGAVITVERNKKAAKEELRESLRLTAAQALLRGITREEIMKILDQTIEEWN